MSPLKLLVAVGSFALLTTSVNALSIVQEVTLSGGLSYFAGRQQGGVGFTMLDRFSESTGVLEGVRLEAWFDGTFTVAETNPHSFPLGWTPSLQFGNVFAFGGGGVGAVVGPTVSFLASGSPVTLAPGNSASAVLNMNTSFSYDVPVDQLGIFIGDTEAFFDPNSTLRVFSSFLGGDGFVSIDARLTYIYSEPKQEDGTPLPDTGSTVLLLASALLFIGAARLRTESED